MGDRDERLLEKEKPTRLLDYKARGFVGDQETRRHQLLLDQKRRREESLNAFRRTNEELFCEGEFHKEEEKEDESMDCSEAKPKRTRLKDMFMLSEWMVNLPEDFEEKWLFLLCPVGKRCFVHCARGYTAVYGKRGQKLAKFQSPLPNGSHKDFTGTRYSNSEVTILDCIWCSLRKTYFVLDVLSWKGQLYMDTETSFRAFWIKSKLEEMPWLLEHSERNPFPFRPLSYHPCSIETISEVLADHPSDGPKVDGLLFYHSEAYYTPGPTPLVVWLKPYMLPEMMGLSVPERYLETRPPDYANMEEYITTFEEKRKQKTRRQNKKSRSQMELPEEAEMQEN